MPTQHIEAYKAWKASNPEEYKVMSLPEKESKMLEFKRSYLSKTGPQQNIERAKAMVSDDPVKLAQLQAMQSGQPMRTPTGTMDKLLQAGFPRTVKAAQYGDTFAPVSAALDVASMGQRSLEAGLHNLTGGGDPLKRMGQLSGRGIAGDIATDPLLLPSLSTGIGAMGYLPKGMGVLPKMGASAAISGLSQVPMSAMEQYSKTEMGEDFDGRELGTEVVGSAIAGGLIPGAGSAFKAGSKFGKKALSKLSGVTEDVLEKVDFSPVKRAIKSMTKIKESNGKPMDILQAMSNARKESSKVAGELLNDVDNFESKYIKENPIVMKAVSDMGSTSNKPIINKIESLKQKPLIGEELTTDQLRVNKKLDQLKRLVSSSGGKRSYQDMLTGKRGSDNISYDDILKLRRNLDKSVNYRKYSATNPQVAENLKDASKSLADFLRGELVQGAKNTGVKEYVPAMESMAKKYDLYDSVIETIGGRRGNSQVLAKQRQINLLNKLNEEGSTAKKEVLEALSDLTGESKYLDHADLLEMAKVWEKAKNATGDAGMVKNASTMFMPEFGATGTGMLNRALGAQQAASPYAMGLQQSLIRSQETGE